MRPPSLTNRNGYEWPHIQDRPGNHPRTSSPRSPTRMCMAARMRRRKLSVGGAFAAPTSSIHRHHGDSDDRFGLAGKHSDVCSDSNQHDGPKRELQRERHSGGSAATGTITTGRIYLAPGDLPLQATLRTTLGSRLRRQMPAWNSGPPKSFLRQSPARGIPTVPCAGASAGRRAPRLVGAWT